MRDVSAPVYHRYVALGDSFTEGVGDDNDAFPNGVRGWADRVAKQLGKADPGWQYANLGIRSFRLREVVAHQLSPALAMADGTDRTIITCFAGANDVLDLPTEMAEVAAGVDALIARLAATGATVVLFTSYDVKVTPLLEPFRRRNDQLNAAIRTAAERYGAVLIDHHAMTAYADPRLWASDRLHMSPRGHKLMAATVLTALGLDAHGYADRFDPDDLDPLGRLGVRQWVRRERRFWGGHVLPLVGRKLRRTRLSDGLEPKWPELVRSAKGLRKLARKRQARLAESAAR